MTEKQQIKNYIKIMKLVAKYGKDNGRGLFGQYDKENGIVYISDGCCIFPIPSEIYIENSISTKCPTLLEIENGKKVDLKNFIMEIVNDFNPIECIMTTLLVNFDKRNNEKLAHVYKCGNDFGVVDKKYVEIMKLLPPVLSAYNPIAKNTKTVIVGYTENYCTMGYAILPIYYNFENTMSILGFTREDN